MKKFLTLAALLLSTASHAGVHCTEAVKTVVLHQNGNVYFTSSKTCPNWCQIKWAGEGDKDRALSQLLVARTTEKPLTFYWRELNNCETINPTYSSPEYVVF